MNEVAAEDETPSWYRQCCNSLVAVALASLMACSGGGGEDEDEPDVPDPVETGPAAIEGVWTGTATNAATGSVRAAVAFGNRAGDAILHVQAGVDSIVVRGDACCDGDIDGEGDGWTLVNQRKVPASVNLLVTDLINNGKALSGDVTVEGVRYDVDLRRDADYQTPLTFGALAGPFTVNTSLGTWMNFTISSTGAFSGADSVGCQYSGQVRIPDATRNLFEITSLQMSGCSATAASRNGAYTGMGYLRGHASASVADALSFVLTGPLIFPMAIPGAVSANPSVTLTAEPSSLDYGGTTTLTWSAQALSACVASGAWTGARSITGTFTTAALTDSATYTLTCSQAGLSRSASVNVTVAALPPDPGTAGLQTLTGIDSNSNGVRDDAERSVLQTYSPGPTRTHLLQHASLMNDALVAASDTPAAREVFTELFENLECLYNIDPQSARNISGELVAAFLNTPERAKAYVDFSSAAGGATVIARDSDQLNQSCE